MILKLCVYLLSLPLLVVNAERSQDMHSFGRRRRKAKLAKQDVAKTDQVLAETDIGEAPVRRRHKAKHAKKAGAKTDQVLAETDYYDHNYDYYYYNSEPGNTPTRPHDYYYGSHAHSRSSDSPRGRPVPTRGGCDRYVDAGEIFVNEGPESSAGSFLWGFTLEKCMELCDGAPDCLSFAFNANQGACWTKTKCGSAAEPVKAYYGWHTYYSPESCCATSTDKNPPTYSPTGLPELGKPLPEVVAEEQADVVL